MVKIVNSVCRLCGTHHGGCGIDVHVDDGKIVKIEGTRNHPSNNGRLCARGLAAIQLEYDPNRLQYPMKRVGGKGESKWQRISWDEAMDTIVSKLKHIIKTDGPRAICWFKGQAPGWEGNVDWCQRFMNSIGSPNLVTPGHNCQIARSIGHVYTYGSTPDSDYENTRCMLLWGDNPITRAVANIGAQVIRAKQRGAKLIVIDPRFSEIAAKADLYVQPRPGSDGALALAMLNVIIGENLYDKEFVDKWTYGFDKLAELVKQYPPETVAEITWVPADLIRRVARVYATTKPAILHEANGLDMLPNVTQTARALAILRVVTGNLDVPGGDILNPAAPPFQTTVDMSLRKKSPEELDRAFRDSISTHPLKFYLEYCAVPEAISAITTEKPYPIRAIIVQGMNPAVASSNTARIRKALTKVDFLVTFDIFMSATAELADIVLPAATFLERTELYKFSGEAKRIIDAVCYQLAPKAIEPLGECKADYDFIADLTRRMGYEESFPWESVEEAIDYELEPIGISCKELREYPESIVKHRYSPQELYRKYEKFFSLPMLPNKAAIYSTAFENLGYDPLPAYKEPEESPRSRVDLAQEYPLLCMAGLKPGLYTHSQFQSLPWLKEIMPDPWVEIHARKAEELGIKDGETVVVESRTGTIELTCKVTNTMHPNVVAVTHGWGNPYVGTQPTANIITPHEIQCPISSATSNRCFLVKVARKI